MRIRSNGNGKGDKNRTSNLEQYRKNWEKIFGKQTTRSETDSKNTRSN